MKIEKSEIIEGKNEKILKNIRLATQSDFNFISKWLKEEFDKYGEGFWANISVIADCFNEKQLFVYIYDNVAIGFITGPINGPSILNIKKGYKRKGVGGKLFKCILGEAIKNKISVIKVECNPKSSINFWKKMGFFIEEINNKNLGYMIIEYKNDVFNISPVEVSINTYSEDIYRKIKTKPLSSYSLKAFMQKDGRVVFRKRLFLKKGELLKEFDKDLVLSIKIDGKEIYFDKAKRPAAEQIGIRKSEHDYGYYIDYLEIKNRNINE